MMNILMLYPKFPQHTFWNVDGAMKSIAGKTGTMPPLGLLTIASYLPDDFKIRLIDRNVEEETEDDWNWADAVFFSLMGVQAPDLMECVLKAKRLRKPVAVGGPATHAAPEHADKVDWICFQEAEDVMDQIVTDLRAGRRPQQYHGGSKTDMHQVRVPRFDLLRHIERYSVMPLQFSRGCPFRCEFCDIIEIYGRVPRTKAPEQILEELEMLESLHFNGSVFLVDDNFIGNKKNAERMAEELAAWGEKNNFPYAFHTEASINLADEDALLSAMFKANFKSVFIGIETPDPKLLKTTLKTQNIPGDPLEKLAKIRRHGIHVTAGFIIGFDGEGPEVFDAQRQFIEASGIGVAMIGLLEAIPHTQLSRRLEQERRLLKELFLGGADQTVGGLNFIPKGRLTKREYLERYASLVNELFAPKAFFERILPALLAVDRRGASWGQDKLGRVESSVPQIVERFRSVLGDGEAFRHFQRVLGQVREKNPAALHALLLDATYFIHLHAHAEYVRCATAEYLAKPSPADVLDRVIGDVAPVPAGAHLAGTAGKADARAD